ncbi:MAG: DnaB-like helicase C-terminal domain-containing protein [Candidatus Micrarchaeaceae archaeon]
MEMELDTGIDMAQIGDDRTISMDDLRRDKFGRIVSDSLYYIKSDPTISLERQVEETVKQLLALVPSTQTFDDYFWRPTQHSELALNYVLERMAKKGLPGYDTGFRILNDMLGGFESQNIYVLNARPGTGKTTLLLQLAWHLARQTHVVFFSPEARARMLSRRLLSALSHVPGQAIRRGDISEKQLAQVRAAAQLMKTRPLFIYDMPEVNIDEMNRVIDRVTRETGHPPGAIFVDYLQQMQGEDSFQDLTNNMKSVETLTVKRDVATIMASQVGRASGDGSQQSAGKGTGKIEELATAVLGFILPENDKKAPDPDDKHRRILVCSKNREEGIHFKLGLRFNPTTGWLEEEGAVD